MKWDQFKPSKKKLVYLEFCLFIGTVLICSELAYEEGFYKGMVAICGDSGVSKYSDYSLAWQSQIVGNNIDQEFNCGTPEKQSFITNETITFEWLKNEG